MAENTIILRLEGFLQSWGTNSAWDYRDSDSFPGKAAIVGLLGCAMGIERGSAELPKLAQAITMATRADRPGVKFIDFQTVTGHDLMTANGTPRKDGSGQISNTIITPRAYLQDACFTVFIQTIPEWENRIVDALQNPKWCIYLGCKSCVPSRPILAAVTDEYVSLMDAVRNFPLAHRGKLPVSFECEYPDTNTVELLRPDELIGANRQFAMRRVWRGTLREVIHVSE